MGQAPRDTRGGVTMEDSTALRREVKRDTEEGNGWNFRDASHVGTDSAGLSEGRASYGRTLRVTDS